MTDQTETRRTDRAEVVPSLAAQVGLPTASRIGQATAVEQTRAAAEVFAAVRSAQELPRNIIEATERMRVSCSQPGLAERAFYRYPRGGKQVTGPTIQLARELARCFGNFQFGVGELRRDDEYAQSEMIAWAWDVETNVRDSTTFIVPHIRDRSEDAGGARRLIDLRDIYENNANMGARRLREQILALLPPFYVTEAKDICARTITTPGGKPLPQVIADTVASFAERGVRLDQLEGKIGLPRDRWIAQDVATLRVIWTGLTRGELRVEEEFPPPRVTADEITDHRGRVTKTAKTKPEPTDGGG